MREIEGTPIGSPDDFAALADRTRELIGSDLIAQLVQSSGSNPPLGVFGTVRCFAKVEEWKEALRAEQPVPDVGILIRFAMLCHVVNRCSVLAGAEHFLRQIRDALASQSFDQFEAALFEGEVAIYWLDQMRATSVEFGPPAGHPDIWATLQLGASAVRIAIECKRLQAVSDEVRRLQGLADDLEGSYKATVESHGPLKCIVWLHQDVSLQDSAPLKRSIAELADRLPVRAEESAWTTSGEPSGSYQVSLARLGRASEFQSPGPVVDDVPAEPVLVVRSQMRRETEIRSTSRITSILALRSDRVASRIGNLRENLSRAIDQLSSRLPGEIGSVAIRIKPPRALGDLWEADSAVRASIVRKNAANVALVILFWDESETSRASLGSSDQAPQNSQVHAAHSLRPHFVSNPGAILRFDAIDSRPSRFPDPIEAFVRDAVSGDVRPISREMLEQISEGADLPQLIAGLASEAEEFPEDRGDATLYWKFQASLREILCDEILGILRAGRRQFRIFLEHAAHLRVIEIADKQVKAVATVDLRAWLDGDELGLVISWEEKSFKASLWRGDGCTSIAAASSRVPPVLKL